MRFPGLNHWALVACLGAAACSASSSDPSGSPAEPQLIEPAEDKTPESTPAEQPTSEAPAAPPPSDPESKTLTSLSGEPRFIKSSSTGVKLFLSQEAMDADDPTLGFDNSNSFSMSCGPNAVFNMYRWYGIDDLVNQHCASFCPNGGACLASCVRTPETLGVDMHTNNFTLDFGRLQIAVQGKGTTTRDLLSVLSTDVGTYAPAYSVRSQWGGMDNEAFDDVRAQLRSGHPVAIPYLSGETASDLNGHFAVIVGMEKTGAGSSDEIIYLANIRRANVKGKSAITRKELAWRWDRTLSVNGPRDTTVQVFVEAFDEHPFVRISLQK
jgi:hypothetical protein